jgi:RimJ/RimL family protein N-acetyltransferase
MADTADIDQRIVLRPLTPEDAGQDYVDWMNDPLVVRYLESRWNTYTLASIREYIEQINASSSDFLYGIFLGETGRHIGNIKIGEVNQIHKFANVGLLLGDKSCWGRGFGTQAIRLATGIAFSDLRLNCLTAGIYEPNHSSYRAFMKAGWEEAGRFRRYRLFEGNFVDQINVQKYHDTR